MKKVVVGGLLLIVAVILGYVYYVNFYDANDFFGLEGIGIRDDTVESGGSGGGGGMDDITNDGDVGGVLGGRSSGGSDGGSSGPGGSSGVNCVIEQISYSMENLFKNSTCNQFNGVVCIDKTVICKREIHNLDSALGNFEVELIFVESGKDPRQDGFDVQTQVFDIGAGSFELFEGTAAIQGELADKNINCFYFTAKEPTKEVCV